MKRDFFDDVRDYLKLHPKVFALLPFALSILCFVAAWKDWDWFFEGDSHGIGAISAYLGRRNARIAAMIMGWIFLGCSGIIACFDTW